MPFWLPGSSTAGAGGASGSTALADVWGIAVGGFVGALFGLAEGIYSKVFGQSRHGEADRGALILHKIVRRGGIGLGVSTLFQLFGRLLRLSLSESRYTRMSKKGIPLSQLAVFIGTWTW